MAYLRFPELMAPTITPDSDSEEERETEAAKEKLLLEGPAPREENELENGLAKVFAMAAACVLATGENHAASTLFRSAAREVRVETDKTELLSWASWSDNHAEGLMDQPRSRTEKPDKSGPDKDLPQFTKAMRTRYQKACKYAEKIRVPQRKEEALLTKHGLRVGSALGDDPMGLFSSAEEEEDTDLRPGTADSERGTSMTKKMRDRHKQRERDLQAKQDKKGRGASKRKSDRHDKKKDRRSSSKKDDSRSSRRRS